MSSILQGDCLEVLKTLPSESVDCCVTSPPYYGLRNYGVDRQLGLENTIEEYISNMVAVFREVKRILKPEATLWLNLGDSYAGSGKGLGSSHGKAVFTDSDIGHKMNILDNCKPKDLIGIPWMVAFALRADGWYLRQDIIWSKPNPMPESVQDRCTKSHEYIFLLSKSSRYYFDNEAIKEDTISVYDLHDGWKDGQRCSNKKIPSGWDTSKGSHHLKTGRYGGNKYTKNQEVFFRTKSGSLYTQTEKRNKRSVWTVTPKAFKESHFATYPPDLIEPMILAGCPEGGIVLDPFFGSGTTGLVAKNLQRDFIGIELNQNYISMAKNRIYGQLYAGFES